MGLRPFGNCKRRGEYTGGCHHPGAPSADGDAHPCADTRARADATARAAAYPYSICTSSGTVFQKSPGRPTFKGTVCQRGGEAKEGCESVGASPKNDVCVPHWHFMGRSNTKCSGCGGEGWGNWGFAPFGQADKGETLHDKVRNQPIEIYLVNLSAGIAARGALFRALQFEVIILHSDPALSDKWTRTIERKCTQCTEITIQGEIGAVGKAHCLVRSCPLRTCLR